MYKGKVKGSIRDFYNFSNRIIKFVFFAGNNDFNKCVSVLFHKGLIIFYLDIFARCGIFMIL